MATQNISLSSYRCYPDYIIPLIYEAYGWGANENEQWRKTRARKVASLLCWADPGVFEPEVGNDVRWKTAIITACIVPSQLTKEKLFGKWKSIVKEN